MAVINIRLRWAPPRASVGESPSWPSRAAAPRPARAPPLVTEPERVAEAIRDVAEEYEGKKPLLACFLRARGAPLELRSRHTASVPSFALPEAAAMAEDLPEIEEMDLNQVKVLVPGEGCIVVEARVLLKAPDQSAPAKPKRESSG